jgi:hypothetical protein
MKSPLSRIKGLRRLTAEELAAVEHFKRAHTETIDAGDLRRRVQARAAAEARRRIVFRRRLYG